MCVELNILLECFQTVCMGRLWICGFFSVIIGKLHLISYMLLFENVYSPKKNQL